MQNSLYDDMYILEKKHWWFKARRNIILNLFKKNNVSKNINILDCGCGCGYLLSVLQKYGNCSGIDFSKKALDYTKTHFKGTLKQCDLSKKLYIESNSFDVIFALDVIEHIDNDFAALKNIKSLLKSNGFLILTVPAFNYMWSHHDDIHMHKRRYTLNELKNKLHKSGFKI